MRGTLVEQATRDQESELVVLDRQIIEERNYWLEKLSLDVGDSNLRLDYSRPATYASDKEVVQADLAGDLYDQLMALTDGGPFLLYTTLMAVLKICLNRYTGNKRIVVGSPSRKGSNDSRHLRNVLAIVDDIEGCYTFRQTLLNVRATLLEAYSRQRYPFERLVNDLGLGGIKNRCALFDVALELTDIHTRLQEVRNDLTIRFGIRKAKIEGIIEYNKRLYTRERVERFRRHYQQLIKEGLKDANATVTSLDMLTSEERHQFMAECPARHGHVAVCVHELFESVAEHAPARRALAYDESHLSYGELNGRANKLARRLMNIGVHEGTLVGTYLERGIELVICILAVLKAGGAYMPLDPEHPGERTKFMIEDSGATVLLTENRFVRRLSDQRAQVVKIDSHRDKIDGESRDNPISHVTAQSLAYLIYTSGSSGQPKAVTVEHGNLSTVILTGKNKFDIQPSDVMAVIASFSFDISLFELLVPMVAGGAAVILGREHILNLDQLTGCMTRITLLHSVPSLMRQIVNYIRDDGCQAESFRNIRILFIGGDLVPPDLLQSMKEFFPFSEVNVLYGPTEATIICSSYTVPSGQELRGHIIGRPLNTACLHLYDEDRKLVPIGVRGEIYVTGAGVTRGYLNAGKMTAEKYVPAGNQRFYKTGDLACYLPDGNIEFLGRIDNQVKIRGFRIELAEIELCLSEHPAIEENVVVARQDRREDKRLVAYIVPRRQNRPSSSELRAYLKERLPDYMVPPTLVMLESLPLTPQKKVDRRALPAPESVRPEPKEDFAAPASQWERLLAQVWEEVLSLNRVGIHDNFFALGGDSIKAVVLVNRLHQTLGLRIPIAVLFDSPDIASFSAYLNAQHPGAVARISTPRPSELPSAVTDESELSSDRAPRSTLGSESELAPIERAPRDGIAQWPLSFSQQRLWVFDQFEPGSCTYNIPTVVRLIGYLRILAMAQSFSQILRRHESLRTTFDNVDGRPVQVIASPEPAALRLVDLTSLGAHVRDAEARRLAEREAVRPFNLSRGPLLRSVLIRSTRQEYVSVVTVHHIVSDAWSMGVFTRELLAFYEAYSKGRPSSLSELPVQYADYSVWQREWLKGEVAESQLSYWRKQLNGIPPLLNLRTDRPRPAVQTYHGRNLTLAVPDRLTESLKAFSRNEGVTLFMTMLAVFNTLLYHNTGQQDIVVGTNVANRNRLETSGLIGFFVNQLVLRTDVSGGPTFRGLLGRVRRVVLGAYAHQDIPFDKVVEAVRPERSLSRTPLFQVKIDFNSIRPSSLSASGLRVIPLEVDTGPAHFELTLAITDADDRLSLLVYYNTDLFETASVEWMLEDFVRLCEEIVARPEVTLSDLTARLSEGVSERQVNREKEFKRASRQKLRALNRGKAARLKSGYHENC
jgi:amino acid adenylation domain-containing protein